MSRIAVERVSDSEWRIVENGAVVLARCAFMKDADRIAEALRQVGCVSVPVSDSEPVTPERSVEDNTLKSPLSSAPGSVEEAKRYAAIGRGFSGATNSLEEALTWVRNNKNGSVYERLAALQPSSPSLGLTEAHLVRLWRENRCGDTACEEARFSALQSVMTGAKTHREIADVVSAYMHAASLNEPSSPSGSAWQPIATAYSDAPLLVEELSPIQRLIQRMRSEPPSVDVLEQGADALQGCYEELERMASPPSSVAQASDWQPIANCPLEGFFLVHSDGAIRAMFRTKGAWESTSVARDLNGVVDQRITVEETGIYGEPTHFMELPAPPLIPARSASPEKGK